MDSNIKDLLKLRKSIMEDLVNSPEGSSQATAHLVSLVAVDGGLIRALLKVTMGIGSKVSGSHSHETFTEANKIVNNK